MELFFRLSATKDALQADQNARRLADHIKTRLEVDYFFTSKMIQAYF